MDWLAVSTAVWNLLWQVVNVAYRLSTLFFSAVVAFPSAMAALMALTSASVAEKRETLALYSEVFAEPSK